jgi:DNA-binding XRE family transcriptional regulator
MTQRAQRKSAKQEIAALAAEIRQVRTRLSLTQGQLAERLGISQQTVSDWEKGQRLRQVHVALRLARFLAL